MEEQEFLANEENLTIDKYLYGLEFSSDNNKSKTQNISPPIQSISSLNSLTCIEAEYGIIASIFYEGADALVRAIDIITHEDFYKIELAKIYDASAKLFYENKTIDLITITEQLKKDKVFDEIGGLAFLSQIANTFYKYSSVESYAKIIKEKSTIRKLYHAMNSIVSKIQTETIEEKELIEIIEKTIFDILTNRYIEESNDIGSMIEKVTMKIIDLYDQKTIVTGIPSGFDVIDNYISGFHSGDLVVIGGRPGMGKTAFALNIATNIALNNEPVVIFSLEMSHEQLVMRMLCSLSEISFKDIKQGRILKKDFIKIGEIAKKLANSPMVIDDSSTLSPVEIKSKATKVKNEYGKLGLIVVDYLQLLKPTNIGRRYENREKEIADISRQLKSIAKDLKVPVIALSQLNREVESRTNKRPNLSDLRESGAIEQDADVIMFIYRDEIYNKDKLDNKNLAEVIIAKQRNGETGTVTLGFIGEYTKFYELDKDKDNEDEENEPF